MGGKFHLKLNNGERPIANKYREGKMQRTLKRELKVLEIVKREAIGTSICLPCNQPAAWALVRADRTRDPWWSPGWYCLGVRRLVHLCGSACQRELRQAGQRREEGARQAGSCPFSPGFSLSFITVAYSTEALFERGRPLLRGLGGLFAGGGRP